MTYVLYHGNCYDGFGAAFAAWLKFDKEGIGAVYAPVNYGQPPPLLQPGSDVYIVDFSYPANVLLELNRTMKKIVVLDHHATAQKDLALDAFIECLPLNKEDIKADAHVIPDGFCRVQNIKLKFDMTKSGAMLAWEYFHPGKPAPLLIQYIQDRDLWKFELDRSRAMSVYLQTQPMNFDVWYKLMVDMDETAAIGIILNAGETALRLKVQMVQAMCKNARMMVFDVSSQPPKISLNLSHNCIGTAFEAPVANATVFFSEVGEELLELYPQAPFAAYYMDRADGKRQWGMRSHEDFDCSAIAKAFGGGGHKQASGFTQEMPW